MSLQDMMYIASDQNKAQTLATLLAGIDIKVDVEILQAAKSGLDSSVGWSRCIAYAWEIKNPQEHYVNERLGITPTVGIDFTLNKWRRLRLIRCELLKATLHLLRQTDWDVALVHGDSNVILLRKLGELFLKKGDGFWTPVHLQMVDMPYRFEDIPVL